MASEKESVLIADTTRDQREEIVRKGLDFCGGACEGCAGCGSLGGGRIEQLYEDYIEGRTELRELNRRYHGGLVR